MYLFRMYVFIKLFEGRYIGIIYGVGIGKDEIDNWIICELEIDF